MEALGNEQLVHFVIDATAYRDETETAIANGTDGPVSGGGGAAGIARIDPRSRVLAGERVTFEVDVERLHLFDPRTGAAL